MKYRNTFVPETLKRGTFRIKIEEKEEKEKKKKKEKRRKNPKICHFSKFSNLVTPYLAIIPPYSSSDHSIELKS